MRNILKKDALSKVWNGTDKVNENNNGGVALWSIPPAIHNAFNPALFVRVQYLHQTDGYASPFDVKPNYITIDNASVSLVFALPTTSPLYIECSTDQGKKTVFVYSGTSKWQMSAYCTSITSIDRVGFASDGLTDAAIKDSSCIYLRKGQAYEDDKYLCKDDNNIIYRNDEIMTVTLVLHPAIGDSVSLSAETFNGKAIFNASEVVKSKFNDTLADFNGASILSDNALFTKYTVYGIAGTGSVLHFMGVNAVSQIGEEYDRTLDGGKVLTRFTRLRWYEGYPLDYSVLSADKGSITVNGKAQAYSITRVLVSPENESILLDTDSTPVLNDNSLEIDLMDAMDIRIVRACIPAQPFYIRWVNDLGGVEYHMFARQQKRQPSVKSISTFAPYVGDTLTARSNLKAYAIATENAITVGCTILTDREHEALIRMPMSPLIEWYNIETGRWIRLNVSKFDGSYFTKTESKSFEVTFSLPTINTQY